MIKEGVHQHFILGEEGKNRLERDLKLKRSMLLEEIEDLNEELRCIDSALNQL